ncbi:hypothetical protein ABFY57_08170 [Paenibacillus polymyxa]|uniref:Uncharacterized protein n=1 Tax=Paenibacillus polymyxa TaxID=1406 RepID=A0A0F6EU89_PAEPO|nr:hypothetical protein [Paenibacillus polymyxa]AHM63841.1 hypothetical protein PPSQR21_001160 [Paenibacillus polymyxa SQR-21]AIY09553.1 hypothetical protein LK13_13585 [Paenibacillus polymyxa]MBE7900924.1 hypothetical protein [Paenibacillus polymyxa]MBG9763829.1 hypothetical protein [Paenibacillus polymyxa]MCC3261484.1 hypothetical protein [Paenibacillus polymyxa]
MIDATAKLIEMVGSGRKLDASIISAYTDVVAQYGTAEDAWELYWLFVEDPDHYVRGLLLGPIMRCGDVALAQDMYERYVRNQTSQEHIPDGVLHVLGYLGYVEAAADLVAWLNGPYGAASVDACLGLVHLPCESFRERLATELEKAVNQNLFNEFLPLLSFKCTTEDMVPRLVHWGERHASVDCNAGIIAGIALFGEKQKDTIRSILWNPLWEAHGTATGSCVWSYIAMQHVGLTFRELIQDIKSYDVFKAGVQALEYRLDVLYEMLELKLSYRARPIRFARCNEESFAQIYSDLFSWSTEHKDDSMIGWMNEHLGYEHRLLEQYDEIRKRIEIKMVHEIELEHVQTGS